MTAIAIHRDMSAFGLVKSSTAEKETTQPPRPIMLVSKASLAGWLSTQPAEVKRWVDACEFTAKPGSHCSIPDAQGDLQRILLGTANFPIEADDCWILGSLPHNLPAGHYELDTTGETITDTQYEQLLLAWGMGYYRFRRYKKTSLSAIGKAGEGQINVQAPKVSCIVPDAIADNKMLQTTLASVYWVRDLINTPTHDLSPTQFAETVAEFANAYKVELSQVIGDDLLKENYPMVHAVGRASHDAPRLLKLTWGNTQHPKLILVGKGVCFDSGGLDLKTAGGMRWMKKDMGGAAHVLGLAQLIITMGLPVHLQVFTPLVENAVGAGAYRPGDILPTRKGLTVEIGNTDAEGRLILSDALAEASDAKPDLIIDFSTLTGAARVALGPDVSVFFTPNDDIAEALMKSGKHVSDPLWRLPLYAPYREFLNSKYADMNNVSSEAYGGAITAALFLQAFVDSAIPWVHFDVMAWNSRQLSGRPEGAEAMGMRAVFDFLQKRYS